MLSGNTPGGPGEPVHNHVLVQLSRALWHCDYEVREASKYSGHLDHRVRDAHYNHTWFNDEDEDYPEETTSVQQRKRSRDF